MHFRCVTVLHGHVQKCLQKPWKGRHSPVATRFLRKIEERARKVHTAQCRGPEKYTPRNARHTASAPLEASSGTAVHSAAPKHVPLTHRGSATVHARESHADSFFDAVLTCFLTRCFRSNAVAETPSVETYLMRRLSQREETGDLM